MQYKDYLITLLSLTITQEATEDELKSFYLNSSIQELNEMEISEKELKKLLTKKGVKFCNQH